MQFVPAGTNLPDGVSGTLTTRNQETQVRFGVGAALVAGTIEIVLSGVGETHSVPAGVGTTTDEIGAALATSIDASPRYDANFNSPNLTIRAVAVGPFTTILDTDGTGITMTQQLTISSTIYNFWEHHLLHLSHQQYLPLRFKQQDLPAQEPKQSMEH